MFPSTLDKKIDSLRRPVSTSDRIPDRFYVISMEFLSLSRREKKRMFLQAIVK